MRFDSIEKHHLEIVEESVSLLELRLKFYYLHGRKDSDFYREVFGGKDRDNGGIALEDAVQTALEKVLRGDIVLAQKTIERRQARRLAVNPDAIKTASSV